jgi:L-ascorbate metabolism protein UlaG (beta-lactamase superfamily)
MSEYAIEIQHISNSFIIAKTIDAKIVCDPWVGKTSTGSWHSFPEYCIHELIELISDSTHVYISHLHSDHFDVDFLKLSNQINKKFIIPELPYPTLKNRLKSIGVFEIIEVKGLENLKLTEYTNISVIPQLTSNNIGARDSINYVLDSSIIINSKKSTFFNQVDNPLSTQDFKQVKKFIDEYYGEIDIACFPCGASSEYPQCFLGIDRSIERNIIIDNSLKKLEEIIEITKPRNTFIAGGKYFLVGKFHHLNKYIAQPNLQQIKNSIESTTNVIELEGGKTIACILNNKDIYLKTFKISHKTNCLNQSILTHTNDKYKSQYSKTISNESILTEFKMANYKYCQKIKKLNINITRLIKFILYDNLTIDSELNILSKSDLILQISMKDEAYNHENYIEIHMDKNTFYLCLTKKLIWNEVFSTSLCMFKRIPNTYEPDLLFSLNFLVI